MLLELQMNEICNNVGESRRDMDLRLKWKNRLVSIHGGADFIYGQFGMGAACIVKLTFDHVWAGV